MNALHLATRHLRHHRLATALLIGALAIVVFLPTSVRWLVGSYADGLTARARATPLVLGAPGNRFDLVLNALHFRAARVPTVPMAQVQPIVESGLGTPIPLHVGFTARGRPVVGTTPEYYRFRGLRPADGTVPLRLGEATLGARAARALGLTIGDRILSDQRDLYHLAAAYPLRMTVVGVLAPRETPDDDAVFVSLQTAWTIAGLGHGHALAQGEQGAELRQFQEITPENRARFHAHAAIDQRPLTAILIDPVGEKGATLLKARTNARAEVRVIAPIVVVHELLAIVLKVQRFFDANHALVGVATVLFLGVIIGLSVRLRRPELTTLRALGASRGFTARVQLTEWALMGLAAALLAGLGVAGLAWALPGGVLP